MREGYIEKIGGRKASPLFMAMGLVKLITGEPKSIGLLMRNPPFHSLQWW